MSLLGVTSPLVEDLETLEALARTEGLDTDTTLALIARLRAAEFMVEAQQAAWKIDRRESRIR